MNTTKERVTEQLDDPVAQELLRSNLTAQLAYTALDGTPRVVPIWFEWRGDELVFASPHGAPKIEALKKHPQVAVSIDTDVFPYKVLQIRGEARVEELDDVPSEYAAAAGRYFGPVQGPGWIEQLHKMNKQAMARISVRPQSVVILDFVKRFPKALT
ncbi:MAG TPA: pyridoxamine 5'-phosphate oxidase family protein [Candidatus Dormibacteraeota bacterium]|nr:pyridoxamine 5'-phosphate oxidase family protein [Candidatus Dormibacteraeota bacterium]